MNSPESENVVWLSDTKSFIFDRTYEWKVVKHYVLHHYNDKWTTNLFLNHMIYIRCVLINMKPYFSLINYFSRHIFNERIVSCLESSNIYLNSIIYAPLSTATLQNILLCHYSSGIGLVQLSQQQTQRLRPPVNALHADCFGGGPFVWWRKHHDGNNVEGNHRDNNITGNNNNDDDSAGFLFPPSEATPLLWDVRVSEPRSLVIPPRPNHSRSEKPTGWTSPQRAKMHNTRFIEAFVQLYRVPSNCAGRG